MKASACARPCTPAPTMSKGPCGIGASRWAASSDAAAVRRAVTVGPSRTSRRSPVATSNTTTSPWIDGRPVPALPGVRVMSLVMFHRLIRGRHHKQAAALCQRQHSPLGTTTPLSCSKAAISSASADQGRRAAVAAASSRPGGAKEGGKRHARTLHSVQAAWDGEPSPTPGTGGTGQGGLGSVWPCAVVHQCVAPACSAMSCGASTAAQRAAWMPRTMSRRGRWGSPWPLSQGTCTKPPRAPGGQCPAPASASARTAHGCRQRCLRSAMVRRARLPAARHAAWPLWAGWQSRRRAWPVCTGVSMGWRRSCRGCAHR